MFREGSFADTIPGQLLHILILWFYAYVNKSHGNIRGSQGLWN